MVTYLTCMSQGNEFTQVMGETLKQYSTCKTIDDFQTVGNRFALIASNEQTQWLPLYYHAHCYIIMSFIDQPDAIKKDNYLDIAEKSIKKMIELVPEESEVYALQSFLYLARLVIDPMARGLQYGPLSLQTAGIALGLDSGNPRAKLIKLQSEIGTARFFGKDAKEFCPQAIALIANWDNYQTKSPLHPKWGKNQVEKIVEGCK